MKSRWITIMLLGLTAGAPPASADPPEKCESWLVFSPHSPLPIKSLRNWPRPDRLVLAIENHASGKLPPRFFEDIRDLKEWMDGKFDLPVCDIDALRTLHQFHIRRLPAWIRFTRKEIIILEGISPLPPEALQ